MPMEKERYPQNWKQIALEIKEKADWKCQKCGKQCRRPGEPFDTHKRTLTVAHLNHTPEDISPENLKAMCAPCHLRYDAQHHAETRRKMKMAKAIHYSPDMVCPYCGNEEFYVKQSYRGTCNYNMRFDMNNDDVENGDMHENAQYKIIGKYAYCNNCGKRLFPTSEIPDF